MAWPFPVPKNDPPNPEAANTPPPEKTQAELIAESISVALQPVVAKMNEFGTRLDSVAEQTKRPEPAKSGDGEPQAIPSVFDDENVAFNTRMTPLLLNQYAMMARMAKDEVRREYESKGYGDAWAQNEGAIDKWLNESPLVDGSGRELRGDKQYIRNTVDLIFGRAMLAGAKYDKTKGFFLESSNGEGGPSSGAPANDGLTTDQRNAARKWGISPEDLKKAKDKLVTVQ